MPVDMKKQIAEAAMHLLFDQHKKKMTVKDIVEECHITRQAFYYHFSDIPDLLRWMIQQQADDFLQEIDQIPTLEARLKYWFMMGAGMRDAMQRGLESNYGKELEQILFNQVLTIFRQLAEQQEDLAQIDPFERDLAVRYHCYAVTGMLASWTDAENENIDRIVHDIVLLASGRFAELKKINA